MSKATENKLGELHGTVATVLNHQLTHTEPETRINEEGEYEETGEVVHTASPATIAAAIKFLKDNQITCDIKTDTNMNNLRETLKKKQQHSRLGDPSAAALKVVGD